MKSIVIAFFSTIALCHADSWNCQVCTQSSSSSSSSSSSASSSSASSSSASSSSSSSSSSASTGNTVSCQATIQPGANVQAAIDANVNKTLCLAGGTYNFSGSLNLHSGTTLAGDPLGKTHLNFSLPTPNGGSNSGYGFNIDGKASNVTIENLDIVSNHGAIGMVQSGPYSNITIQFNRFQYGGGNQPDNTSIPGIFETVGIDGLKILNNYFHDSQVNRNWEIWSASNSNLDYNTSYNVSDGGHFMAQGNNNSISFNYMTHLHRMGQEIQGSNSNTGNVVQSNVFYDWVLPYNDSFGLSVVPAGSINEIVKNNYVRFNIASGSTWGTQTCSQGSGSVCGPNRFGYGIEEGGIGMQITNNTIIMPATTAAGVDACVGSVPVGNRMYGGALWGIFAEECAAIAGWSNVNAQNFLDANASDGPQPPLNTNTYLPVN